MIDSRKQVSKMGLQTLSVQLPDGRDLQANEPSAELENLRHKAAPNTFFAIHAGAGLSQKPQIKHKTNHRFVLPNSPGKTSVRGIDSERRNSSEAEKSAECSNESVGSKNDPHGQPQTLFNSQMTTTLCRQEANSAFSSGTPSSSYSQATTLGPELSSPHIKVYSLQKEGDWRQEKLSRADVLQRLAKLDLDPMGVLDKKLRLPKKKQVQVDEIQKKVNGQEADQDLFEWNLRQLELKEKRLAGMSFRRSWSLLAVIVYLEREAQHSTPNRLVPHHALGMGGFCTSPLATPVSDDSSPYDFNYVPASAALETTNHALRSDQESAKHYVFGSASPYQPLRGLDEQSPFHTMPFTKPPVPQAKLEESGPNVQSHSRVDVTAQPKPMPSKKKGVGPNLGQAPVAASAKIDPPVAVQPDALRDNDDIIRSRSPRSHALDQRFVFNSCRHGDAWYSIWKYWKLTRVCTTARAHRSWTAETLIFCRRND